MNEGELSKHHITWITWESHRRSIELAKSLNAELLLIDKNTRGLLSCITATVTAIKARRRHIIIVQNPSRILAALAALLKLLWGFPLVVDRHTNFRIGRGLSIDPRIWFVVACSHFSLRVADITIVSNHFLKTLVERQKGTGFVLPDRIPIEIAGANVTWGETGTTAFRSGGICRVMFICTFAFDEPYREVIAAAESLPPSVNLLVSGNYSKALTKHDISQLPENVTLLGFVDDETYIRILSEADVVLDFTSLEWCLVCGGYEALAAGKPFVTSNTAALRDFYGNAAKYCDHSASDIANAITAALANATLLARAMVQLRDLRLAEWEEKFELLQRRLKSFTSRDSDP